MRHGKKKRLKKDWSKEGVKTKVMTSKRGRPARMKKRGWEAVHTTGLGTAKNESPTGPKRGKLGGHVIKTVKRATVYQKPRRTTKKGITTWENVRHL